MDEYKILKLFKTECILILYKEHYFLVLSQQIMLGVRMLIHKSLHIEMQEQSLLNKAVYLTELERSGCGIKRNVLFIL